MKKLALAAAATPIFFALLLLDAGTAQAHSSYFTDPTRSGSASGLSCQDCHSSATATCNGCHAHGTHGSSADDGINLTATTDKDTYAPGETVTVTLTGGYRDGWFRAGLFDETGARIETSSAATSGTTGYSVTIIHDAPSTAGTVTWSAGWYGNQYDAAAGAYGSGTSAIVQAGYFTPDGSPGAPHGWQVVAVPAFTVEDTAPATPAIALDPVSLDFGAVTVGATKTLSTLIRNTGIATLTITSASLCAGTPGVVTFAPAAPRPIAAAASAAVDVTYAPTAVAALPAGACLVIASDDPAHPTTTLALSGSGVTAASPPRASGGCSSGAGAGGLLECVAVLLALVVRARARRGVARRGVE